MTAQEITEDHRLDADGNPAGGMTWGLGFVIYWQDGPLRQPVTVDGHTATCRWETTSSDECEYRDSHVFCLRPEHACDCNSGERDPTGAFVEDVIVAAIGRLEHYNGTKLRCRENSLAITHLQEVLHWLQHRAADRETRGVEGTHQP